MKVLQKDLIDVLADDLDMSKQSVEGVLENLKTLICQNIKIGNEVYLLGFGKFVPFTRKSHNVVQFRTGKMSKTRDLVQVKFRPALSTKKLLNDVL